MKGPVDLTVTSSHNFESNNSGVCTCVAYYLNFGPKEIRTETLLIDFFC